MFQSALVFHIFAGSFAIITFWGTFLSTKGSKVHRAIGKWFFVTMLIVALSVGPLLFLKPGNFDPAYIVQFTYLALCVFTVVTLGWTAIRWKNDLARFRGLHFRILGPVIFVLGLVVLAAGIASGNPVTAILSWVGLVYGTAMMRFAWMRGPVQPKWWLGWHLNAVSGLFNAAHGTFLFVAWRSLTQGTDDPWISVWFQVLTLVGTVAIRLWFGARFGVPLRFATASAPGVLTASIR